MSTPSGSNKPSDYAPRPLRGLAALGLDTDGSKLLPTSTKFHSPLEQSADSIEAHLAALKNSLMNKDIPVPPPPIRPGPQERRQARGGQGNITEWLRKAAMFACVATIGATLAVGTQVGYERWKKSEPAAKGNSVLIRSIPTNSTPIKSSADPLRANNGETPYAAAVEDRVVPTEPAPEQSAPKDASRNVV